MLSLPSHNSDVRLFCCQRQAKPLKWVRMFINTLNLPALGYQVTIPETGYVTRIGTGLEDTVNEVLKNRVANPRFGWPTDRNSVRAWVLNSVEARLRAMPGGAGMQWLVGDSPPPDVSFTPPRRTSQPARAAVERNAVVPAEIKEKPRAMPGIGTLISWLGSGLTPVEQAAADGRASTCARCKNNVELEGIKKAIGTVGDILHSIAQVKNHMKLATPHDSHLRQCDVCLCVLTTKVWTPIEHVKAGTPREVFDRLDAACWIRNELASNEPLS